MRISVLYLVLPDSVQQAMFAVDDLSMPYDKDLSLLALMCCTLVQSKTHVVLATLRRSPEELSSHHPKMFKIDDHLGVAVSGLNSDGRSLSRYMRTETLNHRLKSFYLLWIIHFAATRPHTCQLTFH